VPLGEARGGRRVKRSDLPKEPAGPEQQPASVPRVPRGQTGVAEGERFLPVQARLPAQNPLAPDHGVVSKGGKRKALRPTPAGARRPHRRDCPQCAQRVGAEVPRPVGCANSVLCPDLAHLQGDRVYEPYGCDHIIAREVRASWCPRGSRQPRCRSLGWRDSPKRLTRARAPIHGGTGIGAPRGVARERLARGVERAVLALGVPGFLASAGVPAGVPPPA
jgi:hypothetical protein